MYGALTASVSGRDFSRTVPRPLSSRTMPAMALRLTMVERWICRKVAGSSRASSSRIGVRSSASPSAVTTVVTGDGEALLRTPIRELLERLDPNTFKQIHRSTIVNLKAIAGIVRDDSGRGTVRLKSRPETLAVSAPYMALFRHM